MGKKQSRRSISVRGATYERLRAWCETNGVSMSEFIELRITEHIGPDTQGKAYRPLPAVSQIARASQIQSSIASAAASAPAPRPTPVREPTLQAAPETAPPAPEARKPVRPVEEPAPIEVRPEVKPVEPPRLTPVPASAPIEAVRPVRITPAPAPAPPSAGRPAPTPASQVVSNKRTDQPGDRTDYRSIRF